MTQAQALNRNPAPCTRTCSSQTLFASPPHLATQASLSGVAECCSRKGMIVLLHANESHLDLLSTFHERNRRLLLPLNSNAQEYFREQWHPGLSSLLLIWREVSESMRSWLRTPLYRQLGTYGPFGLTGCCEGLQ